MLAQGAGAAPWHGVSWGAALEDLAVVLVVEDDPPLQVVVEDALTDGGFEPAIAPSGEEAVTLLKGYKGKYRALVTDIKLLGRIDGWEVAKQARQIDPEFPIVYLTGAHAHQWASHGVPNSVLLTKPFAPAQLVTAVSQLLNAGTPLTCVELDKKIEHYRRILLSIGDQITVERLRALIGDLQAQKATLHPEQKQ